MRHAHQIASDQIRIHIAIKIIGESKYDEETFREYTLEQDYAIFLATI